MQGWLRAGFLLPLGFPSPEHEAGQESLPSSGLLPVLPPWAAHPEQDQEPPTLRQM